jgi:hypothetical protein
MAKSTNNKKSPAKKIVTAAKRAVVKTVTEVRNTAIPKLTKKKSVPAEITRDAIARRAYEIYASGTGGSETDNWLRAERELRGI